ncbi:hypothetical protein BFW38_14525 [Terasakiispira papahanaumokuakeensis]|uniref:Uncharacterized protein n=1 Tax=Terasakiispira papahanaumokuakeensis TaxID=197479 RepID=A0A1E2VC74_9GAMM|nr:hypothetical protein [Terasakiispira papahanaumokuakeensis]ODC04564.1 hypothetical protein BFW38_14525 [Terasakiispira papahanaumokuakeensis]
MSLSAIIVMLGSMVVLWGVANSALIVSMRRQERKLALIQSQGGFEPFSPRAFQDLQQWCDQHSDHANIAEVEALLQQQEEAMKAYPQRFY